LPLGSELTAGFARLSGKRAGPACSAEHEGEVYSMTSRLGTRMTGMVVGLALVLAAGRFSFAAPPLSDATTAPARELSRAFEAVAARVKPAVVSVYSEKTVKLRGDDGGLPFGDDFFRQFFGPGGPGGSGDPRHRPAPREYRVPQHGMGSGMIVDTDGHILTNYHVVSDVDKVKIQLADKRQFDAEVVGTDQKSDMAIIKIKGRVPKDLPTVTLGDSDALQVGDWVLAIGAPFGLTQTVTAGIISATGRGDVGVADYEDFLQTDAAINPGNSGGPLVDMSGFVIGINTAIATSIGQYAGVGFAIPSDMVKRVMPTLVKGESVTRGFLGVSIQDVTAELAGKFHLAGTEGALVSQISAGSPAENAGFHVGDVILKYRGKAVTDTRELRNLVAATDPGTKADVTILRDGVEKTLTVSVGKLSADEVASSKESGGTEGDEATGLDRFGLSVQPLTTDLAQQLGYEGQQGVLVASVDPGGPAASARLQPGDLIVEVDRAPVRSVEQLRKKLEKAKDNALLLVRREEASVFVVLKAQ
jgi:serine protease Do